MENHVDKSGAHSIQIVLANDDHTFSLDEEALTEVLLRDEIKDRHVVVISVAGAFRKGKSFLLDFFLRYMNSKVLITCKYICLQLMFKGQINLNITYNYLHYFQLLFIFFLAFF